MLFRRFQYFLVAAEELSFQKAAQRLFISQQALSIHIQKLEESYGVRFFERKPRLRLTLAGEHMILHCKRLMEVGSLMSSDLSEITNRISGKILVGTSPLRGGIFIPKIWDKFHQIYPDISFSVKDTTNVQMESRLLQGEIDLYIGANTSKLAPLEYLPLTSEILCCVVHKSVLHRCGIDNIDEILDEATTYFDLKQFLKLANFPYVLLPQTNRIRMNIDRFLYETDIVPNLLFECSSHTMIWEMCKRGCGVSFLSPAILYDSYVHGSLDSELCIFPVFEPSLISNIDIVYLKAHRPSSFFTDFIRITQDIFGEYSRTILKINRNESAE